MLDLATLGIRVDSSTVRRSDKDLDKLGDTAARTETKIDRFSRGAKASLAMLAKGAALVLGSFAALGAAGVQSIVQFGSSLSNLEAISRATTSQMEQMRAVALDLGSTTRFSASEAASGLTFLAMAGFSASEAMAAIPGVLDLAAASGMELARAADIASNIMSAFSLDASEAGRVSDVLAAAASRSNTNVEQLGQAMKFAGPVANALGISTEEAAAAIGKLSDAGLQGTQAGTGLRTIMSALAAPTTLATAALRRMGVTLEEVNPQTQSLVEIIGTLQSAGLDARDAIEIFGREGSAAILALTSQSDGLADLTRELENAEGAASEMAATMMDNLGGDVTTLKSAFEGLVLAIGDAGLTAALRGLIQVVTATTRALTGFVNLMVRLANMPFNWIQDFRRELFDLGPTSRQVEMAIDNVSIALADERRAMDELTDRIVPGRVVSLDMARAKLAQARAHMTNLEAMRAENVELVQQSANYRTLSHQISQHQSDILSLQGDLAILENNPPIAMTDDQVTAEMVTILAHMEELRSHIAQATFEQDQMVAAAGRLSPEFYRAQEAIALLEDGIATADGLMVTLGASTGGVFELSERLRASFAGGANAAGGILARVSQIAPALAPGISAAQRLVAALGRALGPLRAVAAGLARISGLSGALSGLQGIGSQIAGAISGGFSSSASALGDFIGGIDIPDVGGGGGGGGGGASGPDPIEEAQKAYQRLMETLDPLVRAQREFEDAQKAINDALGFGIINTQQAEAALALATDRYEEAAEAARKLNRETEAGIDIVTRFFGAMSEGAQSALKYLTDLAKKILLIGIEQELTTLAQNNSGASSFFSMLGSLAGFSSGGPTGNVGVDQIAGVVHGQEYVINAKALRVPGVFQLLEQINALGSFSSGGYTGGSMPMTGLSGAGIGGTIHLSISSSDAVTIEEVRAEAVSVSTKMLDGHKRELPRIVKAINNDKYGV